MTIDESSSTASEDRAHRTEPFQRQGLALRLGPFAAVAVLAEASLALPPGPMSTNYTVISVALLVATALCVFLPWGRLPVWADVVVPLLYVGSVLTLVLAAGGSTSGVGIVILIPLIWTVLYHRPSQSVVVVAAVITVEVITALTPVRVSDAALARRVVFWAALATLIALATHELRARLQGVLDQRQELIEQREEALGEMARSIAELERRNRQSRLMSELGDMLQACISAEEAYEVIARCGEGLFEGGGALSIMNSSRNLLETMATWGPSPVAQQLFSPNDCWALRRGRVHASDEAGLACAHLRDWGARHSLCVPMIAQGDTVGVLHVFSPAEPSADAGSLDAHRDLRQLALTAGERIGMSVANFRLRDTLRNQSIRDPLTNLFNRRYMEETFTRELGRATRDHEEVGIIQVDIDHFKNFNDTYGHDIGDAVLRSIGDLLLSSFRDLDVPCRYGGEEFTLILPNSSLDQTQRRAEELQRRVAVLRLPFEIDQRHSPTPPTLSIGISSFPIHGTSSETLIRAADQALYAAKSKGRNVIVCAPDPAVL
jgi:diguanylate cyclase (GGDEF)-like protein